MRKAIHTAPYIEGLWKVLFLNYLMYRRETRNLATIEKYTPDCKYDLIDCIPNPGTIGTLLGASVLALSFRPLLGVSFWTGAAMGYLRGELVSERGNL